MGFHDKNSEQIFRFRMWRQVLLQSHLEQNYQQTVLHNTPTPHLDFLEQTIDYKVPVHFFDDLALFDGSLYPDRTAGEASAKYGSN